MLTPRSFRSTWWISAGLLALILGIGWLAFLAGTPKRTHQADHDSLPVNAGEVPPEPPDHPVAEPPIPLVKAGPVDTSKATGFGPPPPAQPLSTQPLQSTAGDLPLDFLDRIVSGNTIAFKLPDGSQATGGVGMIERDANGVLFVQGRLTHPSPGFYFFQRQTIPGVAGPLVGNVRFDGKQDAWKIEPTGNLGAARLNARKLDDIICANYHDIPEAAAVPDEATENSPQTHPFPVTPPSYQTITPLQSLPGATGVVYLDFDGEQGPFPGWGDFDALPAGGTNAQFFDVWKMVCEDFQGFNLNVTTDRKVFDSAPEGRRVHCIISPTTDAAPGAGGVAYVGSFNWSGDRVCWAFYSTGKSACEVISHEIGHTLQLSHDGRTSPSEGYYGGHGTDPTGWAPIMGVGYYKKLSQWSKGEYLSANQTQDDLAIIVSNNDVDYRSDDMGEILASAQYLEVAANNTVSNEGIIETTGDIDAFRFVTTGGQATLNVNTVTLNPNLDILAEIVDAASSTVVASDNPDTGINATVSMNLAAGEYLLRIRGTGRGTPLGDGYTNYGSLGSYLVTGTVTGGIKPERFTIAENSANGSPVGTVVPRNNHAGEPLAYAIASGNDNGAFTIDSLTGAITVANSPALDFEALSLRWDDPATFGLFVTITNSTLPSLNETLRTVVTVTNINEAPSLTGGAVTILEHTSIATPVFKVIGSDPDRFDFPTYSITAGNTGNAFSIDSGTGQITVAGDIDVAGNTAYNLTVQASDLGTPSLTNTAAVSISVIDIAGGYLPGKIVRTYFENIAGGTVANLTGSAKFPNTPDSEEFLDSFDGIGHGDNFGSTIRGYVIPPSTGSYQFWIASDDASELRLGTNATPASATVRATVSSYSGQYAWTANASQQSTPVTLTAGQPYYIEARHKEGGGGDHVAVAWSGPGITRQVISGLYLAPFYQNYAPKINPTTLTIREDAVAGQPVGTATSSDVNAQDTFSGYAITGGNTGGVFAIHPATGLLQVAQSGLLNAASTPVYTLTLESTDNGTPALTGTGTININVIAASSLPVSGIVQEIWTGIAGTALTGLTGNTNYPHRPNVRRTLSSFDSGSGYGDNYGSRIRAVFLPQASGDYRFYIAGDDDCRLLFSTNATGSGATQIATISGWTEANQWTKYSSQTSALKSLIAGQPVYLEALQKESGGGDHVSVGYTGPGVAATTVIPGAMLQPFNINVPPVFAPTSYSYNVNAATATAGMAVGTVTATEPNGETIVFAVLSGNPFGAFAIDPATGEITIANPAMLANGDTNLEIAAQDGGLGSVYPLASATASVVVHVTSGNSAPIFTADPILVPNALENAAYSQTVAGSATDANPGDTLAFSKVGGPSWLTVASNGDLSGTPGDADPGPNNFNVRVTDSTGLFADATLNILVTAVNDSPAFATDPITTGTQIGIPFAGLLDVTDPDAGDTLTCTKVSGPAWLGVAADGTLSGTPLAPDIGLNSFTVRVTDEDGLVDEATLNITVITVPTWIIPAAGTWTASENWLAGVVGNGTDSTADFSTLDLAANPTVTLDGPRTIGHLVFADSAPSNNWILASGANGTLAFNVTNGVPSVTVINQTTTISAPISGTQGLLKAGAGTLILGGVNTFSGGTSVSSGTLKLSGNNSGNSQAGTGPLTIHSGAIAEANSHNSLGQSAGPALSPLVINGGTFLADAYNHVNSITFTGGAIGIRSGVSQVDGLSMISRNSTLPSITSLGSSATSTVSSKITLANNTTFSVADGAAATDLSLSGVIVGSGTFTKTGSGTLALTAANTYTSGTTIHEGTLSLGTGGATGTIRGTLNVNAGATVNYTTNNTFGYSAGTSVNALNITGGTVGGSNFGQHFWNSFQLGMTGGTLRLGGTTNEWHNATVTVQGSANTAQILGVGSTPQMRLRDATPITFNVANGPQEIDLWVDVAVSQSSGTSALNKTGPGTLRLSRTNTYTGATTVNDGTLLLTGSLAATPTTIATTGILSGTGTISGAVTNHGLLAPGVSAAGNFTVTNTLTLAPDSDIEWQISDWTGAAGTAYDKVTVNALNVTATALNPVIIRISSLNLANFAESGKSFTLIANSGTLTGFSTDKFQLESSGFVTGQGTWAIQQSGNNIMLVYIRANTAPVFTSNPILLGATEDQSVTGSIAAVDPDLVESLTYSKLDGPSWLSVSTSGMLSGTPTNSEVGMTSFTVGVTDSFNATDTATLQVAVANVNDAPVFASATITGNAAIEDSLYAGTLSGIASDPDSGDTLIYTKTSGPAWLDVAPDGALSGTPVNGDVGANMFIVRSTDAAGLHAEATLDITVANVNDAPVFASATITGNAATEDSLYAGTLSGTASDPDSGDTLIYTKTSGPAWLDVAPDGALSGTPVNGDVGANMFIVRSTDAAGLHAEATLDITVANVNDAPVFASATITGNAATEDSLYAGTLSGTASDPDPGDTLIYTKTSGPAWLDVAPDGALSGTPVNGDVGANMFIVRSTDAAGLHAEATLDITVANVNDAPVFASATITGNAATEDSLYAGTLSGTASDPDPGDTLIYTKTSGPAWLEVAPDGTLSGTPVNADVGANLFTVRSTDTAGLHVEATLEITVANFNDPPVFAPATITGIAATEDSLYAGTLSGIASDPDPGDALIYSKTSGPAWLDVASDGTLSGTPVNGDVGPNLFTVRSTDTGGLHVEATLEITVANVNDSPVFASSTITGNAATEDSLYAGTLSGIASDPDSGDTLTYSKTSGPAWLDVAPDGTLSGTPANGDVGPNMFIVRSTDAAGLHAEATLEIAVAVANPDVNTNGILDSWEISKFGNADPGSNLPADDDDHDGLSNLLEFALGTHPLLPNVSPLSSGFASDGSNTYLQLTVPRNPEATNLVYLVEVCGDLAAGPWSAIPTVVVSDTPTELIVRDSQPVGGDQERFLRLRVHASP